MKTPFENDPFALALQAFENLYPNKDCKCVYGRACTGLFVDFDSDGNGKIRVPMRLPVSDACIGLIKGLARVAVGPDHQYDIVCDRAFDKIRDEYNRLVYLSENHPEEFETVRRATERARRTIRIAKVVTKHEKEVRDSFIAATEEWREKNRTMYDNTCKMCVITWVFIALLTFFVLVLHSF